MYYYRWFNLYDNLKKKVLKLSKRHLAKTISWRFVGTLDTLILAWIISGDFFLGAKISILEVITKMVLYYFHERIWFKSKIKASSQRHLFKTITWRIIGTLDTVTLGWLISGDPFIGLKIGFAEVISKMILYYIHEKVWYRFNYGLDTRNLN